MLVAALLPSCRPDTVELAYRFERGTSLSYVMTADASSSWTIGGSSGSGSYRVVLHVRETVEEADEDSALVRVTMTPIDIEEDGLPSPGSEERSFVLRAGRHGEVLEVLEVGGVPATDLDPDELAFIGTYRPPLPLEPVGLGGSWDAEQEVRLGQVFQQVVTIGEVDRLSLSDGAPAAHLEYDGEGPLEWTTSLTQGDAQLTGSSTTRTTAILDLDRGVLQRAVSRTNGLFEVEVVTSGDVTITGTLELELRLDLRPTG